MYFRPQFGVKSVILTPIFFLKTIFMWVSLALIINCSISRLDFNSEQQNNIATSDFGAGTTVLINGRPGQIQAPVHSQRIVNNTNLPMAQFARPFTENQ
jgi:hypothetical protein